MSPVAGPLKMIAHVDDNYIRQQMIIQPIYWLTYMQPQFSCVSIPVMQMYHFDFVLAQEKLRTTC